MEAPRVRPPLVKRRTLVWLGIGTVLVLWGTAAGLGAGVFASAIGAALLPLPVYIAAALWFDRFEPEPRGMLALAFLWGASVAILVAGLLNQAMDAAIGERFSSIFTAPLFEELLKAVILIRFFTRKTSEFDGIVDGVIYAAMVGLGFAFVENIDYYGRSMLKEGPGGLAISVTLRGVMGPFSHPLFTSLTGVGLGLARQTHRRWVRRTAPAVGFAGAVALHSMWNVGASLGCVFFVIYLAVMIPAMIALLVVAVTSLRAEGTVIRTYLADTRDRGMLSAEEFRTLCSVRGRLRASIYELTHHGWSAWRLRRAFHGVASELAFLRHRVADGDEPADPGLEAEYVGQLIEYQARTPAIPTS